MYGNRQYTTFIIAVAIILVIIYQLHFKRTIIYEINKLERILVQSNNQQRTELKSKLTDSSSRPIDVLSQPLRINRGIAMYSKEVNDRISKLTSRKVESRDPELISLIREIMDRPSDERLKPSRLIQQTPQVVEVEALLKEKTEGFFVECGALDGERSSNSLYLEQHRSWAGLLVEMDPHYYTQLLGKSRGAWSIHACLSPYNYVLQLPFHGDSGGQGRIDMKADEESKHLNVPCFPFESLMLSLNRTHVDYFSLDVEGVEFPILQTIPFDRITIDVMSVEYGHDEKRKNETIQFMEEKGFTMHKDIHTSNPAASLYVEDFIFVRRGIKVS